MHTNNNHSVNKHRIEYLTVPSKKISMHNKLNNIHKNLEKTKVHAKVTFDLKQVCSFPESFNVKDYYVSITAN